MKINKLKISAKKLKTENQKIMTIAEFNSLKYGSIVYYVTNSGSTGIQKYQYIGIHKDHVNNEQKHVFISEYLLSTVCLLMDLSRSRYLKAIFLTENEAKEYHKNLFHSKSL
jgi:hypothetical protein